MHNYQYLISHRIHLNYKFDYFQYVSLETKTNPQFKGVGSWE